MFVLANKWSRCTFKLCMSCLQSLCMLIRCDLCCNVPDLSAVEMEGYSRKQCTGFSLLVHPAHVHCVYGWEGSCISFPRLYCLINLPLGLKDSKSEKLCIGFLVAWVLQEALIISRSSLPKMRKAFSNVLIQLYFQIVHTFLEKWFSTPRCNGDTRH